MELLLKDLTWVHRGQLIMGDLRIRQNKILQIGSGLIAKKSEKAISLRHHYLYPGLINGHDHLEMNLYPRMGNPPYENYTEWAKDIYKPTESPVKELESVPMKYRLQWGGFKNLISGVTTVIHHNPWHRALGRSSFPVKVLKKYAWAHSLAFDQRIVRNFPTRSTIPFIVHAAEGVDDLAMSEIRQLNKLGVLGKNTVIVHGIGLSEADRVLLSDSAASLVWCPSSNLFMFGQTTDITLMKDLVKVCIGSDSLMTGSVSLLEEIQTARKTGMVTPPEILEMVTSIPARIFNLAFHGINEGGNADLLILPISKPDYYENLAHQQPSLVAGVLVDGNLYFADEALAKDLNIKMHTCKIGNTPKGIVLDLADLQKNILKKVGSAILQRNPLWQTVQA